MKVIEVLCLVFCSVYLVTRPGARTTGEQGKAQLIWKVASLGSGKYLFIIGVWGKDDRQGWRSGQETRFGRLELKAVIDGVERRG